MKGVNHHEPCLIERQIKEVLKIHNEKYRVFKQENALFELLCGFYNTARYMRFNIKWRLGQKR